jgi:hypothetical protein
VKERRRRKLVILSGYNPGLVKRFMNKKNY